MYSRLKESRFRNRDKACFKSNGKIKLIDYFGN